jgi:hypothetical protein
MLVSNTRRSGPANKLVLEVLLKNTARRSRVVVIELPKFLLGELVCIAVEDGATLDAVKDFFVRGWIIGGFNRNRGDSVGQGRGNVALLRRVLLPSVSRVEGLFEGLISLINRDEGSLSINMGSQDFAITSQHPSCRVRFVGGSNILELLGGFVSVEDELFLVQKDSSRWNQSRRIRLQREKIDVRFRCVSAAVKVHAEDFVEDEGVVDLGVTGSDGGKKTFNIGMAHLLGQDLEEVGGFKGFNDLLHHVGIDVEEDGLVTKENGSWGNGHGVRRRRLVAGGRSGVGVGRCHREVERDQRTQSVESENKRKLSQVTTVNFVRVNKREKMNARSQLVRVVVSVSGKRLVSCETAQHGVKRTNHVASFNGNIESREPSTSVM